MSVRFRFVNMLRQQRQHLVGDRVPEVEHAVALADEARAEDHVGLVLEDRLHQLRILGRIVFQVGVLHEHHVAGGVLEAFAQGRALALVHWSGRRRGRRRSCFELLQDVARAVGAAIVDDDDFLGDRHGLHAADHFADPAFLVVDRDDDRELEAGGIG